jgi:pimeloyl-ACP methyl ester carboxylesterase
MTEKQLPPHVQLAKKARFCPKTQTWIDLAYEEFGPQNGHPLLLVAGLNATMLMFDDAWIDYLCKPPNNFRVIRFDNRDAGLSTNGEQNNWPNPWLAFLLTPNWASPKALYDVEDMARDSWSLLDHLKIKYASLCGFSMGSVIVQRMALLQPERVITLIPATGTTTGKGLPSSPIWIKFEFLKAPPKDATLEQICWFKVDFILRCFIPKQDEESHNKLREFFYKHVMKAQSRNPFRFGILRQLYGLMHSEPFENQLKNLKEIPVLAVHGSCDLVFPEDHAKRFKEVYTNCELLLLSDMGHVMSPKHYQVIADAIGKHARDGRKRLKSVDFEKA